jgi:hypothetical protein
MNGKLCLALLSLALFLADDCGSKPSADGARTAAPAASAPVAAAATTAATAPATPAPGACALIQNAEVEAVQGGKVQAALPNTRPDSDFAVSQCFYTAASADGSKNLSVHVEVMSDGEASPGRTKLADFWRERFREAKDKRKSEKPRLIEGVGEEAYWVGNERVGTLYVLKSGRILRLSLGGPEGSAVKIEKSKALASKAVARLD